jgi:hypothetical protein
MALKYMHAIMETSWLYSWGPRPSTIIWVTTTFQIVPPLRSSQKVTTTFFSNGYCGFVLHRMKTQQYKIGATCT